MESTNQDLFMTPEAIEERESTRRAMLDPQVGDCFQEMLHFWVFVVARDERWVTTMEAASPCRFPEDGVVVVSRLAEFGKRFEYTAWKGHYWVHLHRRGCAVDGWLDGREEEQTEERKAKHWKNRRE